MAFIIDTHCHISGGYNDDELESLFKDSKLSGVKMIFDVGYDMETNRKIASNILEYTNLYGIIGIHPDDVENIKPEDYKEIEKICSSNKKIIAIGEIGLDYYHMNSPEKIQKEHFIKQLKIAKKLNLFVSLHLRDKTNSWNAYKDCLNILKSNNMSKGILHCYSGNEALAQEFIKLGFFISISGIVTFKNAKITQEVVKQIPLNKILVETDAPYLSPEPYRGTKNNPKYINYTINKIAELKSIPVEEVIKQLHKNTLKLLEDK